MATLSMHKISHKALIAALRLAGSLLAVLLLYILARNNYLAFHTLVEGFSIIVAALIYVLATRTYKYSGNGLLLFIGNAYLFIAIIDFLHTAVYKGMNILPGYGSNTATQLWIAGRYLAALSFLLAAVLARRRFSARLLFWVYTVATSLLLLSIMWLRIFPDCYIDGRGLTIFKITSEYLITLVILVAMLLFFRQHRQIDQVLYHVLMAAMACTALSELSFTLYVDVYGMMNFVGHIFKAAAYALIYAGVVLRGLDAPYETIFLDLKVSSVTDNLTGLYNRQGTRELFKSELFLAVRRDKPLGMLLMDLDCFKDVNDRFGHLVGDQVLKGFADMLRQTVREKDVPCRLGGDEFTVLVRAGSESLQQVERRIRDAFAEWSISEEHTRGLGLSIGHAIWEPGMAADYENLVREADQMMYREKDAKSQERGCP